MLKIKEANVLIPPLRIRLILVTLILILGVAIFPAKAAEPRQAVNMSVEPALQGYFKYGEWLPVWVSLENTGADQQGEVRVSVRRDFETITYSAPVSLANGARKRLPIYVLPNNFTHELKIDFVVDEEILESQTAIVRPQPNINYLIGVAAQDRGALSLLPGIQLPGGRLPIILDINLDTLPERSEGLRSLDCLILNDIDASELSIEQISALATWVQQGGKLVIGGGAGALKTAAGLPDLLLPLRTTGLTDIENLDSLSKFSNAAPVRVPGPFVIALGENLSGLTLLEQDGIPLVRETVIGDGSSTFIALDLSNTPFDAWTGTTAFWETIIGPGSAYPDWMPPDMSPRQMAGNSIGNALSNLPSLDLPSAKNVAFLLVFYIILVGPVNYFVLRWRKKLHWAWISIPLITLIFTGLSFGIGYAKRGTDILINKIAIIQAGVGDTAQVKTYVGLFSPANQNYEVELAGDNLLSPLQVYYDPWNSVGGSGSNLTFVQSNPSLVRGLSVNQWSMQSFMTETSLEDVGQLNANLQIKNGALTGTITNDTGYPLKDVIVLLRPNFIRIGDLDVDTAANVDLEIAGSQRDIRYGPSISWEIYGSSGIGTPSREQEFKRMVLESVIDQQYYYGSNMRPGESRSAKELDAMPTVTILGWLEGAPPEVFVNGESPQESANSLLITETTFNFPEEGEISFPVGLLPGVVASLPFSGGICGPGVTSVWIEQGEAVFEFIIPSEIGNIEVSSLNFSIQIDSGIGNPLPVDIFDWQTEDWQPLEDIHVGDNTITDPADYINGEGLIQFRISAENRNFQGGSCYYTALGFNGSR